eukprot:PLAT13652.1.p1 GENE.PLAT13652.1~~PLAT13652.1.p1  ORF type:complete len:534 (-),score=121.46 PLAT13652.1:83-1684(-)
MESPARTRKRPFEASVRQPAAPASPLRLRSIDSELESRLSSPGRPSPATPTRLRRERESKASPVRPMDVYSDRYIPSRSASVLEDLALAVDDIDAGEETKSDDGRDGRATYRALLDSELLDVHGSPSEVVGGHSSGSHADSSPAGRHAGGGDGGSGSVGHAVGSDGVLKYKSPKRRRLAKPLSRFSASPVAGVGSRLRGSPRRKRRKIEKLPFKVLDAPSLEDDYYLNLIDWSSQNVLAVGLGPCVYLWNAATSTVTKLCDLAAGESVAGLSWAESGKYLAVGTRSGRVHVWDSAKGVRLRCLLGHDARCGSLDWKGPILATGSRDRSILLRDMRLKDPITSRLSGHRQEVCGLRWSRDGQMIASGGNDNRLLIWDAASSGRVQHTFTDHQAAVKAIAWSPHQRGLLASGGGTADRHIRFWNARTGSRLQAIDTKSQVCNLRWSNTVNELVSTHGYSLNQVIVWRYPSMSKLVTLTGHTYRVLYLAMSPDGRTIVTGAGDETLRFWNVFPSAKGKADSRLSSSPLLSGSPTIR